MAVSSGHRLGKKEGLVRSGREKWGKGRNKEVEVVYIFLDLGGASYGNWECYRGRLGIWGENEGYLGIF